MTGGFGANYWRRQSVRLGALAVLAVAVLGTLLAFRLGEDTWYGRLIEEVAFAFLIAALLGLSIDFLLKHDLVEDSFRAAIGYLLPEELRPELAWIHDLKLVATCEVDFEIHRLAHDRNAVLVTERMTRALRNLTKSKQQVRPSAGLDEWFYPGRLSRVTKWTCTIGERRWERNQATEKREPTDATVGVSIPEQWVNPGETCTITTELEQVRAVSDQAFDFFGTPTSRTKITIRADDDLGFSVAPQHRERPRDLGNGVFQFDHTLLPGQVIRIRWWEKKAHDEWMRSSESTVAT